MNTLAKILGSCFGVCMLPILIFAYIILAIGEWSNSMLHLWRSE